MLRADPDSAAGCEVYVSKVLNYTSAENDETR